MAALQTINKSTLSVDLLRDDCKVIERRGGSPADVKKAFAKLRRVLGRMPDTKMDTVAEVRRMRSSPRAK